MRGRTININIMKEIEQIAEEHSIKELGRVSPTYQLGFTQGAKWAKGELTTKVYHALEKVLARDMLAELVKVINEVMKQKTSEY